MALRNDRKRVLRRVTSCLSRRSARWPALPLAAAVLVLGVGAEKSTGQTDNPRLRWEYFLEMRSSPGVTGLGQRLQAARQVVLGRPVPSLPPGVSAVRSGVWSPLGPRRIRSLSDDRATGRVSAVTLHPGETHVIFAGGAQGGVWRSDNGGDSWRPLTDDQCSLAMGAIAVDPVNPSIVYAGTGEQHFSGDSYYGCGVLRSTDGGESWDHLGAANFQNSAGGATISRLAVDPVTAGSATSTVLYAASSWGFYRSGNSGRTWTRTLSLTVTDLLVDPESPENLLVGGFSREINHAVRRSEDGGRTWETVNVLARPVETYLGRVNLARAPSDPGVIYAVFETNSNEAPVIYRTSDGGTTWSRRSAGGASCYWQCWYDMAIAVDPHDPDVVYFGAVSLYRSDDGAASFREVMGSPQIHVDQHIITTDPRMPETVLVGNDGGVYRSTDRGETWTSLNTNLELTQFYGGVSVDPHGPWKVLGGTQDNGTVRQMGDGPDWRRIYGGDGGYTAVHPTRDRVWLETQWARNSFYSGPRRADNGGDPRLYTRGINLNDEAKFIPPLVMDPFDPEVLYFGTTYLYRTSNSGRRWEPILAADHRLAAIAPARSSDQVVYAATLGIVYATRDGGGSWTEFSFPPRWVSDLAVDPFDAGRAWATLSGFGTPHVYMTQDYGASWSAVGSNLPDHPVNAVLVDPGNPDQVFIGTDLGVFVSNAEGSWERFDEGLPTVAVFALAAEPNTGVMVAGTHGRGAFSVPVSAPLVVQLRLTEQELKMTSEDEPAAFTAPVGVFGSGWPNAAWTATHGNSEWLTLDGATGFGYDSLAWTVDPQGLKEGVYQDTINVAVASAGLPATGLSAAGDASVASVPVTLEVRPLLVLDDPSRGPAASVTGVKDASESSVEVIINGAGSANNQWLARITSQGTGLELVAAAGRSGDRLAWRRSPGGLPAARYVDTIRVVLEGSDATPLVLVDTFSVAADLSADAAAAALTSGGAITARQELALDQLGNGDGVYNLGDFLSWLDRCRSGGAVCGGAGISERGPPPAGSQDDDGGGLHPAAAGRQPGSGS